MFQRRLIRATRTQGLSVFCPIIGFRTPYGWRAQASGPLPLNASTCTTQEYRRSSGKPHLSITSKKINKSLLSSNTHAKLLQSCLTLWPHGLQPARLLGPWDFPGKNTGVVAATYSGGSSWPRDWTCFSFISCICRQIFFTTSATWEAPFCLFVVQSLSCVWLFETPWTAARQTTLSFTISWSLLKLMSIESVTPFNHLILGQPLLLLPSVFPSIRVFSSELALRVRWPKYLSFSISPSNEYSGLLYFRIDWFNLLAVQGTLKSLL